MSKPLSISPSSRKKGLIKEFDIVDGIQSFQFRTRINALIKEGWQPYGDIFIADSRFCIAMVKL